MTGRGPALCCTAPMTLSQWFATAFHLMQTPTFWVGMAIVAAVLLVLAYSSDSRMHQS